MRSSQNSLHCSGALSTDELKQFAAQAGLSCLSPQADCHPALRLLPVPAPKALTGIGRNPWEVLAGGASLGDHSVLQYPEDIPLWSNLTEHHFCSIDCAKAFDCVDHNKLWKTLKEMGIPDHLTCLLRNRYAGQEATVRTGHGTTDWFQIGKGVPQGCILSPCLFNLYAEYIMRKVVWMKQKLE